MNKFIGSITVVIVAGLIIGVSTFKVVKSHNEKVLLVESKYIIEKAKDCWNQKLCIDSKVTLKTLYDNKLLDRMVNGITKEYYNELSYITKEETNYQFVIVN